VQFHLVYGKFEASLPLSFAGHIEERLLRLLTSDDSSRSIDRNRIDLARRIVSVISAMLDGELLPPSSNQVKYAGAIAQELQMEVPPEALQFRDAMAIFLSEYAPKLRQKRASESDSLRPQAS